MKAALNGVPSLSVLDGWWIEGCIEGVTGWSVGQTVPAELDRPVNSAADAESLYEKLETKFLPAYRQSEQFTEIMRHSIALNGSFFNTQRMMQEYVMKAYFL
jgi:starch phosphorylase